MTTAPATSPRLPSPPTLLVQGPRAWWRVRGADVPALAMELRRELGLPDAGTPVIMSGHQAGVWHCGILAKWFALRAGALAASATAAWIVVDHDANDPLAMAYPTRGLTRGTWRPTPVPPGTRTGLACGRRAPEGPAQAVPEDCWSPDVASRLAAIARALDAHQNAPSAAMQAARAACDLLDSMLPGTGPTPRIIRSLDLAGTSMFGLLLALMLADPEQCVRTYNAAAASLPAAGVHPLRESAEGRWELPVWIIEATGQRRTLMARAGDSPGAASMAPKALLMTALLRLGACDVFIHGLGGGLYDQVMERWLRSWLGDMTVPPALARDVAWLRARVGGLAPAVVVSATATLSFAGVDVPTPDDVANANWRAHRAFHDPALLGEPGAAEWKRDMASRIAALPRPRGAQARALFREMHARLDAVRSAHASTLRELSENAARMRAQLGTSRIVHDRTWPFALHAPDTIARLREMVDESVRGA